MTESSDEEIELTSQIRRRLRDRRRELRFSQREVAEELHISQSNICRIENTRRIESPERVNISREHLQKIAVMFECSEHFLLCRTDNPQRSEQADAPIGGIAHHLSASANGTARTSHFEIDNADAIHEALAGHSINTIRRAFFDEVFKLDYDGGEFESDLQEAVALSISGTNLRRVIVDGRIAGIIEMLERLVAEEKTAQNEGWKVSDHVVQILMHHPRSMVMRTAMIQDQGPGAKDFQRYQQLVHRNLSIFCLLRERFPTKVQIRTMNYMPAFGLDLLRHSKEGASVCYVRVYPLPDPDETYKDKPIARLTPTDGEWYARFAEQFERHWNGVGKDLRKSYPWWGTIASMKAKRELRPELLAIFEKVASERTKRK